MAIKNTAKPLLVQLTVLLFLGWLLLGLWALSLWLLQGYSSAETQVSHLITTQVETITAYHDPLLASMPLDGKPQAIKLPFLSKLPVNEFGADLIEKGQQLFQLMRLSSHYFLIKLCILLAAIPLFAMALTVGLVEGLSLRAIRKACLGRESSYVFHRLIHYLKKGLVIFLLFWLALPISISPAYVFGPISLLMGGMMIMTASRFKKYL